MFNEQVYQRKRKKFLVIGIILIILGLSAFVCGPILATIKHPVYILISMVGIIIIVPGSFLLMLGIQRPLVEFQAQSAGPVAVDSAKTYGKQVVKEMAKGVEEGFTDDEIYCKYCGNLIDSDSEFCKYCGKKIN